MPGIKLGWGQAEELARALLAEAQNRQRQQMEYDKVFGSSNQPPMPVAPPSQHGAQGAWGRGAMGAWGATPQMAQEPAPWTYGSLAGGIRLGG